jgi:Concanavalin A-like lectin/glucanases superfamily
MLYNASTLSCGFTTGGTTFHSHTSVWTPTAGQWYHVACTYDGAHMITYVNGVATSSAETGTPDTSAGSLNVSASPYNAHNNNFPGTIGDARVYNRALSATEISTLYNDHVSPPSSGLNAWWKFEESGGTTASDSSGNGNAGALIGSPTFTSAGKLGGARIFDGSTQYVDVPDSASLQITSTFTISFWMKAASTSESQKYLLAKHSTGADQWAVIYEYVNDQVEFFALSLGYTGSDPRPNSQIPITDTSWHHIVYAYDGAQWRGYKPGAVNAVYLVRRKPPVIDADIVDASAKKGRSSRPQCIRSRYKYVMCA